MSDFDFYVLSVTYVPAFCCHLPHKCLSSREIAISSSLFSAHGVWPHYYENKNAQKQKPHFPTYCKSPHNTNTKECTTKMLGSDRLYQEYMKHGSCTSLKPKEYMFLEQRLMERVKVQLSQIEKHVSSSVTDSGGEEAVVIPINTFSSLFPHNGSNDNHGNNQGSCVAIKTSPICQLQEIRVCFNKVTETLTQCPAYLQEVANPMKCSSVVLERPFPVASALSQSDSDVGNTKQCAHLSKQLINSLKSIS